MIFLESRMTRGGQLLVSVVITGRGGAGKTTITSNLGTYFSRAGYRTLVIDGDLYLPKLAFHFGIYNPQHNVHTLPKNPDMMVVEAVYHDLKTGVDILPGSSRLYDVMDLEQRRLKDIVRGIGTRYNLTIIDSPVGIPFDTLSTFRLARYQLIIIEIERCPIHSVHRMIENGVVKLKSLSNAYGPRVGVVLNKVRESSNSVNDIADFLEYSVGVPVVGVIPFDHRGSRGHELRQACSRLHPQRARASKVIAEAGEILDGWVFGKKERKGPLARLYEVLLALLHRTKVPSPKKL